MIKRVLIAILLCAVAAAGQSPGASTFTNTSWTLQNPPVQVTSASVQLVGNPGPNTLYFWIVANFTMGSAGPAGPYVLNQGPNALSGSNYASLSWLPVPNATTYDVLLTSSPTPPTGACACAIVAGLTSATYNATSSTTSAYNVTSVDGNLYTITAANVQSSLGVSALQFISPLGGMIGSLSTAGIFAANGITPIPTTIGNLVNLQSGGVGTIANVSDALTSADCSGGSGSLPNTCKYLGNGVWTSLGSGGGGGGGSIVTGPQYAMMFYQAAGAIGYPDPNTSSSTTQFSSIHSAGIHSLNGFYSGGSGPGVLALAVPGQGTFTLTLAAGFTSTYTWEPPLVDAAGPIRATGSSPDQLSIGLVPGDIVSAVNPQSGTTYTVLATDQFKLIALTSNSNPAVTLPADTTSGFGNDWTTTFEYEGTGTATITPTTSTICGASSVSLTAGQSIQIWGDGTNYRCGKGTGGGGGGINFQGTPTTNAIATVFDSTHLQGLAAFPTIDSTGRMKFASNGTNAGQVDLIAGACQAPSANFIGLCAPASVTLYQLLFPSTTTTGLLYNTATAGKATWGYANAHGIITPLGCSDSSGSGTAQSCNTGPSFTPAAGDTIVYTTSTPNAGDLTVNVNSLGAAHVRKWQGSSTLAAGDLAASVPMLMTYDGTYWELYTIGNAPSGGGGSAFSELTGGTNTAAAMLVGSGASLGVSGGGIIGATTLLGNTWASPGAIGGGTPGTGNFQSITVPHGVAIGSGVATLYQINSYSTPIATSGYMNVGFGDTIAFRNHGNTADNSFGQNTGDRATWNGNQLAYSSEIPAAGVSSLTGDGTIFNNTSSVGPVTLSLTTQAKSTFLAGSATLSGQLPTFRVMLAADLPLQAVITSNGNTYSAGLQDFSAVSLKLPIGSGLTETANGQVGYDSTNNNYHAAVNSADALIATVPTATPVNAQCATWVKSGSFVQLGSTSCPTSPAWSSLTNPSGSLSLTMGSNTSLFNTTSAVSQFFAWKNTTAATVTGGQSSPTLAICGQEWHGGASVEGCLVMQFIPGTGTDAANTIAFTHTGSATGATTTSFPGPVQAGSSSGVGGEFVGPEGTPPGGIASSDILYSDSTAHRLKQINNNGTADTVAGAATTDVFTNKTFDTAGSGNVFKINGNGISTVTGTGSVAVLQTSPSLITPNINVATATSVNGLSFTANATGFSIAGGTTSKTLTILNTFSVSATDSDTYAFPAPSSGSTANMTQTVASGTAALGTSAIASGACATVVTVSATGTLSSDAIEWNPNASIKAVTGYTPSISGGLTIAPYPTANNVNFDVCNWTSASITPGAVTVNWRVPR